MKVVLVRDVPRVGKAGDVKEVADGYARNYLLPKKLAMVAEAGAVANITAVRRREKLADHINRILDSSDTARFAVGYFFPYSGLNTPTRKGN